MIKEQQNDNERADLYKHIEKLLDKVGNTTTIIHRQIIFN